MGHNPFASDGCHPVSVNLGESARLIFLLPKYDYIMGSRALSRLRIRGLALRRSLSGYWRHLSPHINGLSLSLVPLCEQWPQTKCLQAALVVFDI